MTSQISPTPSPLAAFDATQAEIDAHIQAIRCFMRTERERLENLRLEHDRMLSIRLEFSQLTILRRESADEDRETE